MTKCLDKMSCKHLKVAFLVVKRPSNATFAHLLSCHFFNTAVKEGINVFYNNLYFINFEKKNDQISSIF